MKINHRTPRIGTKGIPWLFWQRKAQTHKANLILRKPKFKDVWSKERQIQILEDGIYVYSMALRYRDRGYHRIHRQYRKEAKALIKTLNG